MNIDTGRRRPVRLDQVWLSVSSGPTTKAVPGVTVVADSKGFTLLGPEAGSERTIAWERTTGFSCQRPGRLPDGSPVTVLEVHLANSKVLELLLPVSKVPPSETIVVETELSMLAGRHRRS